MERGVAARGEHQDGRAHAKIARVTRQREAVAAGQHDVEDGELKIPAGEKLLAVGEILRGNDLVAGMPQVDGHQLAHQALVFDDGDAISHAPLLRRRPATRTAEPASE